MPRELLITNELATSARAVFEAAMLASVRERDRFVVALSGGSTPIGLYRALADRRDLPWDKTLVFWGDERFVPRSDPDSNARAAREALLDHVPVPADQVFAWPSPEGDEDTADAVGGDHAGNAQR
ncbi:MAG: 6-phosphogluconolactonase, partial [Trueperaceae bacterium]